MPTPPPSPATTRSDGILSRGYALTTIGAFSLVFLAAFEALAVATIMPVVAAELDGRTLYSLAFSSTLAASVIGMVVGGWWSDRSGPAATLVASVAVFALGLVVAGLAGSMVVLVAARFVQGLGSGAITVALYVLVAKAYPPELHPRIFGAFAAAWVVPSLVGPFLAGLVAEAVGWRWVFLGVVAVLLVALLLVVPALRSIGVSRAEPASADPDALALRDRVLVRIVCAVVLALAVVAVSSAAEVDAAVRLPLVVVALGVVLLVLRPLLPRGTFLARRGLPATVLLRGVVAAAFFGTEVYLPLLLHDVYDQPAWASGIALTAGAVSWAAASQVQGRLGSRLSDAAAVRIGGGLLVGGIAVELATTLVLADAAAPAGTIAAAVGWFAAGAGMGLVYPRISTLVLAFSAPGREGANSSAMSIADAVGASVSLAIAGLVFTGVSDVVASPTIEPFRASFGYALLVALLAVLVAFRVGRARATAEPGGTRLAE